MTETRKNALYTLLGTLCFGIIGVVQALVPEDISPILMGTLRITGGSIVLLVWGILTTALPSKQNWPILPTVCGAFGIIGFQIAFFFGIDSAGIIIGTIASMGLVPVIAGLLARIFFSETLSLQWYIYTIVALIGLGCMSISDNGWKVGSVGITAAFIAGVSYAIFLASSKVLIRYHSPESIITMLFTISAVVLSPMFVLDTTSWIDNLSILLIFIQLAIITMVIAFTLIAMGLQEIPLSLCSTLSVGTPFIAVILGVFFLEESLTTQIILGLLITFFSILMLVMFEKNQGLSK